MEFCCKARKRVKVIGQRAQIGGKANSRDSQSQYLLSAADWPDKTWKLF